MSKIIRQASILAVVALLVAGCTSETAYGPCVGAFDDRNPALRYRLSVWNTFLGVVFIETVFVPVVVIANETVCPVGKSYDEMRAAP